MVASIAQFKSNHDASSNIAKCCWVFFLFKRNHIVSTGLSQQRETEYWKSCNVNKHKALTYLWFAKTSSAICFWRLGKAPHTFWEYIFVSPLFQLFTEALIFTLSEIFKYGADNSIKQRTAMNVPKIQTDIFSIFGKLTWFKFWRGTEYLAAQQRHVMVWPTVCCWTFKLDFSLMQADWPYISLALVLIYGSVLAFAH